MNLEDDFSDVVGKAIRGLEKNLSEVSLESGVSEADLERILSGNFDKNALRKLAPALGLGADALASLPSYSPELRLVPGVRRIVMPFYKWTVNAWFLELDGVSLLFDTGWNPNDILSELNFSELDAVFITHAHEDHIGGVNSLAEKSVKIISETDALDAGEFQFGKIGIKAIDLSGHCVPATGYFISGFEKPLWIVGDAIFAGSMGGCHSLDKFQLATNTLQLGLKQAPEGCLILPGHGPITTVFEEKNSNPFHPSIY